MTGLYESGWDEIRRLSNRGKLVQVLYSSAYLEECNRAHLLKRAMDGRYIRVVDADFCNLLIIDRSILVLWGGSQLRSALVIQFPPLLHAMRAFAKMSWRSGAELGAHLASDYDPCEVSIKILTMLENGVKDEVAARELSVSLRTYRRHVARVLDQVGASTRFQAGARAAELGLLAAARAE